MNIFPVKLYQFWSIFGRPFCVATRINREQVDLQSRYDLSRYGAGYDLAARRKNATRESTATLKAWLNEHKKNPYPTKGEKIMLAIITKMTLTQVSTWFANARRRLKKENKMTWEPKNKTDDDDDAVLTDSEDNKEKDDLAGDNQGDRVGEEARRGLEENGEWCIKLSFRKISLLRKHCRGFKTVGCIKLFHNFSTIFIFVIRVSLNKVTRVYFILRSNNLDRSSSFAVFLSFSLVITWEQKKGRISFLR